MKLTARSAIVSAGCLVIGLLASASRVSTQVSSASAVIGRFAGSWKEDTTQRNVGGMVALRFQRNAKSELQELRGGTLRPVTQPVVFDGKPHDVEGGNRVIWSQTAPRKFERQLIDGRTGSGRALSIRRLELSADGKTLTEQIERKSADGATSTDTLTYRRAAGEGQDLVGTWQGQSVDTTPAPILKNEVVGADSLKIIEASNDRTLTVAFDGQPAPIVGPATIRGITAVAKLVDDHTIELTERRGGATIATVRWVLSADGKNLTVTDTGMTPNGPARPSTRVLRKQ